MAAGELARLLLDFGRMPGKYVLRLGEPKELHQQFDTVVQWAMGNLAPQLKADLDESAQAELSAAAVLFVQRLCFAPGNNHYQVLGLTREAFSPDMLRSRYRALIRLTHPDMGVQGLAPDAAGLINRAQHVLADEWSRRQYDDKLKAQASAESKPATPPPRPQTGSMPPPGAQARERHAEAMAGGRGFRLQSIVEEPGSSSARLLRLKARYPRPWRIGVMLMMAGAPMAALLVWAALDTSGTHVITARAPVPGKEPIKVAALAGMAGSDASVAARPVVASTAPQETPRETAKQPTAAKPADRIEQAPAKPDRPQPTASGQVLAAGSLTKAPEAERQSLAADSSARVLDGARFEHGRPGPGLAPRGEDGSMSTPHHLQTAGNERGAEPIVSMLTSEPAVRYESAEVALATSAQAPVAVSPAVFAAPVPTLAPALDLTSTPVPVPVPEPVPTPTPGPAPAPAPEPVAVAPPVRTLAPESAAPLVAGSVPAPSVPMWEVDAAAARRYLGSVVATFGDVAEARRLNNYLASMKVRGSLLHPVLALHDGGGGTPFRVRRSAWTENARPGTLKLRSTVVFEPRADHEAAIRLVLVAGFLGTSDGPVLESLNLRREP